MTIGDQSQESRERLLDEEHLRLLALGHYIVGGMTIAFASMFIFHLILVLGGAAHPDMFESKGQPPNGFPQGMLVGFAWAIGCFIVAGWAFGTLTIYSGRCIKRVKRRMFTLVMAWLNTLMPPFGTVLGVFTLMVLSRPSVKRLYGL
jgi:hypothetical protein